MDQYILALDQGTTSSRAVIFNKKADIISIVQQPFSQHYPQPSWVEHDAMEIWATQLGSAQMAIAKANISPTQIAAIGITNQRETVVLWDRETGMPLHNAIVWQCRRTASFCDELRLQGHEELIQKKTGLLIDAYFSASKIRWLLDNVPGAREQAKEGKLAVGTIDSWLIWRLSQGKLHVTDPSNASRTMLFNIHNMVWDDELLDLFDIPHLILPKVVPSSAIVGETAVEVLGASIAIAGIAGDQQAALFGQGCLSRGQAKNTYGTGCFMLLNTGDEPIKSTQKLLTTVAWQIAGQKPQYALEGSVFIAGAAIQWLRDEMQIINSAAESEVLASSVADTGGVFVVPAFVGLGAPYWDQYARGIIIGITRGTNRAHIARATLESIAYQTCDLVKALCVDANCKVKELRVDGGATSNNLLLQIQADILGTRVIRPKMVESTVAGAAYLAGLACKYWAGTDELASLISSEATYFEPKLSLEIRVANYKKWQRAVKRASSWDVAEDYS
ncbi:MAG: glycerol kinase GlpK [Acidobacteria bacterium]|nr:glycerol kinase GlpK [Acidobacteriota bacterium]